MHQNDTNRVIFNLQKQLKMTVFKKILIVCLLFPFALHSQSNKELKFSLSDDGQHYVKFTFLNQVWARYNHSNPGTTVFNTPKSSTFDIGLRRTRIQVFGQLSDKVFFYTQLGQNNLNYISSRKQGIYFLDALSEYKVAGNHLSIGGGLTAWNGVSRYSSPSIGSILSLDAPLYQQATGDVTDQFVRKFSIYIKGQIAKFDYRMAVSTPMSVQRSSTQQATISENSLFSSDPAKAQWHGYFKYQFKDKESNLTPFAVGSYLGKKSVFNIGAGFMFQPDAMWHLSSATDIVNTDLKLFTIDLFYDMPIDETKGNAITAYAAFSDNDYGKNYVRNVGAMNPANGTNGSGSFNGAGSAFPMMGTGSTIFSQLGYLFPKDLLGNSGTLQPFVSLQYSNFELFDNAMVMYDFGANWLIEGHRYKISANYQSRPVFFQTSANEYSSGKRKGMIVLQFQVSI